ncbi:hypothetical protein TcasGA2_TC009920 [Tribolium castaneum]|uniref:Uncharacterized protein n=1 Tax=Tribolium castaneum TaxID=7070 RepID=D6WQF4_TRICA|nr:hypothetical protein TcasGA2_TC009920 [Tribolium castaneum]
MAQGPHGPQNTGLFFSKPRLSPKAKSLRRLHSRSLELRTFQKRPNITDDGNQVHNNGPSVGRDTDISTHTKNKILLWRKYADATVFYRSKLEDNGLCGRSKIRESFKVYNEYGSIRSAFRLGPLMHLCDVLKPRQATKPPTRLYCTCLDTLPSATSQSGIYIAIT